VVRFPFDLEEYRDRVARHRQCIRAGARAGGFFFSLPISFFTVPTCPARARRDHSAGWSARGTRLRAWWSRGSGSRPASQRLFLWWWGGAAAWDGRVSAERRRVLAGRGNFFIFLTLFNLKF
jgi:hypothetical protein